MPGTLILVPTPFERDLILPELESLLSRNNAVVELCGFGPVASAARSAQLIARYLPQQVILAGIAGAYGTHVEVGAAALFDNVGCYGIGAGTGAEHLSAGEMGWQHWNALTDSENGGSITVGDIIPIGSTTSNLNAAGQLLLTCCSAAGSEKDVELRLNRYPSAIAEDMEGFSVAVACALAGVPLQIIRGISNQAGDRDKRNWKFKPALFAAAELVRRVLDGVDK